MVSLEEWEIDSRLIDDWLSALPAPQRQRVVAVLALLAVRGPALGRPFVDRVHGSRIHYLKELRLITNRQVALRILFVFDARRSAVLLTAGNKAGTWSTWYDTHIAQAEENYDRYRLEYS